MYARMGTHAHTREIGYSWTVVKSVKRAEKIEEISSSARADCTSVLALAHARNTTLSSETQLHLALAFQPDFLQNSARVNRQQAKSGGLDSHSLPCPVFRSADRCSLYPCEKELDNTIDPREMERKIAVWAAATTQLKLVLFLV